MRWSVVIPYVKGLSKWYPAFSWCQGCFPTALFSEAGTCSPQGSLCPLCKRPMLVYRIPCMSCPSVYIGQMSRTLETCLKEHKAAVKHLWTSLSAVANRVCTEHQMNLSRASVLAHETDTNKRCLLEAWFICKYMYDTLNREDGCLPPVYRTLSWFQLQFVLVSINKYPFFRFFFFFHLLPCLDHRIITPHSLTCRHLIITDHLPLLPHSLCWLPERCVWEHSHSKKRQVASENAH